MDDEIAVYAGNDAEAALAIAMMNAMKKAVEPFILEQPDLARAHSMLITVAGMFAGATFGEMVIAGVARDSDQRRTRQIVGISFRQGIKLGKFAAARAAHHTFGKPN